MRAPEPPEGTKEYQLYYLELLANWLSLNPKKSKLVQKECNAVKWAIEQVKNDGN